MNDMDQIIHEILAPCPWYARQLFLQILPLMRESHPYGWLPMTMGDLAKKINAPDQTVYNAFGIFRKVGLIRSSRIGFFSPLVVREITIRIEGNHAKNKNLP